MGSFSFSACSELQNTRNIALLPPNIAISRNKHAYIFNISNKTPNESTEKYVLQSYQLLNKYIK